MKTMRVLLIAGVTVLMGTAAPAATIKFSGYTWTIRPSGRGGPGPNNWDPDNVSVDANGHLHLRLTQRDGKWYSSEVYTQTRLGFGRYEFWLTGPVDRLDKNVVLGLFNYPTRDVGPDGTHEVDIEFARWGKSSTPIGNYTVWPTTNSVKRESKSFAFTLNGDLSKHSFVWTSTNIVFESQAERSDGKAQELADWVFQPTNPAACISQQPMPVHINLWCFKGQPPSDAQQVELVVRAFRFTPL